MKTLTAPMAAHIARPVTTLASCWRITRTDGEVFRFTDHDADLVVDGATYQSFGSYQRTAVANNAGANVDNVDVQFILGQLLNARDIRAGLFDYATVHMFLVNWRDTSMSAINLRRGFLGEITLTQKGTARAELRGLTQVYTRKVVEIYSPDCRADLFDARCGLSVEGYTVGGTVTAVTDRRTFQASLAAIGGSPLVEPVFEDGYYDYGLLTFLTGENAGIKREIKQSVATGGSPATLLGIVTHLKFPFEVMAGDTFTVYPGCDKTITTCATKFGNVLNFRGEPYVPGTDALVAVDTPGGTD